MVALPRGPSQHLGQNGQSFHSDDPRRRAEARQAQVREASAGRLG